MPAGTAPPGAFHAASTQLKGTTTAAGATGCAALGAGELSVKLQQGGDGGRGAFLAHLPIQRWNPGFLVTLDFSPCRVECTQSGRGTLVSSGGGSSFCELQLNNGVSSGHANDLTVTIPAHSISGCASLAGRLYCPGPPSAPPLPPPAPSSPPPPPPPPAPPAPPPGPASWWVGALHAPDPLPTCRYHPVASVARVTAPHEMARITVRLDGWATGALVVAVHGTGCALGLAHDDGGAPIATFAALERRSFFPPPAASGRSWTAPLRRSAAAAAAAACWCGGCWRAGRGTRSRTSPTTSRVRPSSSRSQRAATSCAPHPHVFLCPGDVSPPPSPPPRRRARRRRRPSRRRRRRDSRAQGRRRRRRPRRTLRRRRRRPRRTHHRRHHLRRPRHHHHRRRLRGRRRRRGRRSLRRRLPNGKRRSSASRSTRNASPAW